LIQAATNLINEYYDFKRGLDTADSHGIGGVIVHDGVTPDRVLRLAQGLFAVAVALGVYLAVVTSLWVLVIGLAAIGVAYLYSAGPRPIAYTPLGELVSGILMGGLIVVLAFYIQTQQVTAGSILLALPVVILIGAILMANNLRDLDNDEQHGRRTLAILLGRKRATDVFAAMFVAAYVIGVFTWLFYFHLPLLLLSFSGAVFAWRAIRLFQQESLPQRLMPAMKFTSATNTFFGIGVTVGLIVSRFVR
jgi:1,4-dihydroxy-2-naphthoate octaprenyltransferase